MAKTAKISAIRGMEDLLPAQSTLFTQVEQAARELCARYGFAEIRTPLVEPTELFVRGVGETSDIVGKEMYTFLDRNQESITLRPEGTASVVRAYLEANLPQNEGISRLYYMGPMFRYERPQKGRKRQFHQIGLELFGTTAAAADVEIISLGWDLLQKILPNNKIELQINSLGCKDCRPAFQKKLLSFLQERAEKLCEDCKKRLEKNPLRVLDCKNERCQTALKGVPMISESWCEVCRPHYAQVKEGLKALKIAFVENPRIVRGLDYYMRTAFEFVSDELGAQGSVGGGGRYDGLVADLGGPEVPGVGMAFGVERLVMLLEAQAPKEQERSGVFVAPLSEAAITFILPLIHELRLQGKTVLWDYEAKSLKAQFRKADKMNARCVVMVGDDEMKKKTVSVKDLLKSEQHEVAIDKLSQFLESL